MEYRLKEALNAYLELYKKDDRSEPENSRFLHFENFLKNYTLTPEDQIELINYFSEKEKRINTLNEGIEKEIRKDILKQNKLENKTEKLDL